MLLSKTVGESEAALVEIFKQARAAAPCVLFLDHIEALASRRNQGGSSDQSSSRMLSCLLTEMDGISSSKTGTGLRRVMVLASATKMSSLDPAVLRAGRIELHLEIPAAGEAALAATLDLYMSKMPIEEGGLVAFKKRFVSECSGLTAADVSGICREAAMLALRTDITATTIQHRHFEDSLRSWVFREKAR